MIVKGRSISKGTATGPALVSKDAISFLGGVDPKTGDVIEKGHAIYGKNVKGTVLIFPGRQRVHRRLLRSLSAKKERRRPGGDH